MEAPHHDAQNLTVIVGAGIVGSALAAFLSKSEPNTNVLVLDRSLTTIVGSTGYAPGFIGQYNDNPSLTKLAVESVEEYERLGSGFDRVGGLELASTNEGIKLLESRFASCNHAGFPARLLDYEDILKLNLPIHPPEPETVALLFPSDGVTDPKILCNTYRSQASKNGVRFREASVTEILLDDNSIAGICTEIGETIYCQRIVLATGIWTSSMMHKSIATATVPIIPVSHPYIFSQEKDRPTSMPFLRWPESHVYSRDHGSRYGLGTYDHEPQQVTSLGNTALVPWTDEIFNPAIKRALAGTYKSGAGFDGEHTFAEQKIAGVFSVTPDNLPMLGPVSGVEGLWTAAAIWITHAAGCARLLEMMLRGDHAYDKQVAHDLDPSRFVGRSADDLEQSALRQYNNIYNNNR